MAVLASVVFMMSASALAAPPLGTDFGVRAIPGVAVHDTAPAVAQSFGAPVSLSSAALVAARWGRVTSTLRSVAHNRAVGGVRNSFHLSGRAIDIARRPGVSHAQIAAAMRNAGFNLVESLDEGDHSHFAFGGGASRVPLYTASARPSRSANAPIGATNWHIVSVARR